MPPSPLDVADIAEGRRGARIIQPVGDGGAAIVGGFLSSCCSRAASRRCKSGTEDGQTDDSENAEVLQFCIFPASPRPPVSLRQEGN